MTLNLDVQIRELIAEVVRDEVRRALATATAPDEFLPTAAAARRAHVAPGTIRRWVREGKLGSHHAGRLLRVRLADLQALMIGERRSPDGELSPEDLGRRDFG